MIEDKHEPIIGYQEFPIIHYHPLTRVSPRWMKSSNRGREGVPTHSPWWTSSGLPDVGWATPPTWISLFVTALFFRDWPPPWWPFRIQETEPQWEGDPCDDQQQGELAEIGVSNEGTLFTLTVLTDLQDVVVEHDGCQAQAESIPQQWPHLSIWMFQPIFRDFGSSGEMFCKDKLNVTQQQHHSIIAPNPIPLIPRSMEYSLSHHLSWLLNHANTLARTHSLRVL